jgi:adenine-specific DNA-methyltransferase
VGPALDHLRHLARGHHAGQAAPDDTPASTTSRSSTRTKGLKGGFIYKTVPHVMLKSIANNPEIDEIYERMHPASMRRWPDLNAALAGPPGDLPCDRGAHARGRSWPWVKKAQRCWSGRCPSTSPADRGPLPAAARAFAAFHAARQKMQRRDGPLHCRARRPGDAVRPARIDKTKLRVAGPFTVEAVPFPTVLSLDERRCATGTRLEANLADIARSGDTSRQHQWRDELLKAGIRGKGGQMLKFAELEVLPGTTCLHAVATCRQRRARGGQLRPRARRAGAAPGGARAGEAGELFPCPR